jgi:hypothetical protein
MSKYSKEVKEKVIANCNNKLNIDN